MSSDPYLTAHAGAFASVQAAGGTPVTFTTADGPPVSGLALTFDDGPSPTLFVIADVYGQWAQAGDAVDWDGVQRTVAQVKPSVPIPIHAMVVLA